MWKWFAPGSAFFAALTAILSKVGVQGVPSNLAPAIRAVVILVLAWGLVLARGENGALATMSRSTLVFLVLSGVATALSWLCYFRALLDGPASVVAPLDKLSLPLTIVLAALFLKEKWTLATSIGVAMARAGTYFLTKPALTAKARFGKEAGFLGMDLRGFEPLTSSMRTRRAPNCATDPSAAMQTARKRLIEQARFVKGRSGNILF